MNNTSEDLDPYSEPLKLKLPISKIHRWTAMTLFCSPSFAQTPFREMDLEDWQIHATKAWEISRILAKELKKRKREDRGKTANGNGRFPRRIVGTINDVLALIPENGTILRKELYQKLHGIVTRDDTQQFIGQLLREGRIFIHKIQTSGSRPSFAYSRRESNALPMRPYKTNR